MGRASPALEQLPHTTVQRTSAFLAAATPADGTELPGIKEALAGADWPRPEESPKGRCKVASAPREDDGIYFAPDDWLGP
eukprot:7305602-Alexandrium_andersonii.AAC.1